MNGYLYSDIYGTSNSLVGDLQFWDGDTSKYIYCAAGGCLSGAVYKYGNNYCHVEGSFWPNTLFISKVNPNVLFASDGGTRLTGISTDGGVNWQIDSVINGGIVGLSPVNDSVMFILKYPNLYKTTDMGKTIRLIDSMANTSFVSSSENGQFVFKVDYNRVSISNNFGEPGSWILLDTSSSKICVSKDDSVRKFYVGHGKIIKVYDYNGQSLNESYVIKKNLVGMYKKPGSEKLYVASLYEIDELTPQEVTVIKQIPVSSDFAQWHPLAVGNTWVYKHESHTSNPHDLGYVKYKITGDTVMSNGKTYFCIRQIPGDTIGTYERYDTTTGRVYSYMGAQDVLIDETYVDVGDTVSQSCPLFEAQMICNSEAVPQYSTYTTPQRVFCNTNNDSSYPRLSICTVKNIGRTSINKILNGFPDSESYDLSAYSVNGISGGDTTLLEVAGSENCQIPQFSLNQNYPNPFNPSTTIRYAIPKAGQVKLNVYSVTGKLVASLVDEYKTAGNYTVNFNAANLASGVYFYRLLSGSFVENKKMILLK
jgi:hypothetical protein